MKIIALSQLAKTYSKHEVEILGAGIFASIALAKFGLDFRAAAWLPNIARSNRSLCLLHSNALVCALRLLVLGKKGPLWQVAQALEGVKSQIQSGFPTKGEFPFDEAELKEINRARDGIKIRIDINGSQSDCAPETDVSNLLGVDPVVGKKVNAFVQFGPLIHVWEKVISRSKYEFINMLDKSGGYDSSVHPICQAEKQKIVVKVDGNKIAIHYSMPYQWITTHNGDTIVKGILSVTLDFDASGKATRLSYEIAYQP